MDISVSIIFCDAIQSNIINGRMVPSVIGPLTSIAPYSIPGNYTFSVYCSIANILVDSPKHNFRVTIKDTNEEVIFDTKEIDITQNLEKVGNYFAPIDCSIEIRNIVIKKTGNFIAEVYLDGEKKASQNLKVINNNNF